MFQKRVLVVIAVIVAFALTPAAARADDPWGGVDCSTQPNDSQCTVVVVDPGNGGETGGSDSVGSLTCKAGGEVVPCYTKGFGWYGNDGCYYGKDSGGFLGDNHYIKSCRDPATGEFAFGGTVYLPDPPTSLAAMVRRALSQLTVPKPVIASNPGLEKPQVVHVPVWWWVQPGLWNAHTATASLPEISITATAQPAKITWYAGDGSSTVCYGPGIPWTGNASPMAESDCGHTYTVTSREAVGGKFRLRAAVTWQITWAGAGYSGTEPDATTTDQAAVEVKEFLPVITG